MKSYLKEEKSIMNKIAALLVIFALWGCTSDEMIKTPVFKEEGIIYTRYDQKPANGTLKSENTYYTYRDGRVRRYIKMNSAGLVIEERNYDSYGLLHGRFLEKGDHREYRHGVLKRRNRGSLNESYRDGVLHGKQGNGEIYRNGSRHIEKFEVPKRYKRIAFQELRGKKYSGEVYLRKNAEGSSVRLEVRGYKRGALKYIKHYDGRGLKVDEYHFYEGKEEKLSKSFEYMDGRLISTYSYDEKGGLDGLVFKYNSSEEFEILNYSKGILHGYTKVQNETISRTIKEGWYRLGAFCGEAEGRYYYSGMGIKKAPQKRMESLIFGGEKSKKGSFFVRKSEGEEPVIDEFIDGDFYATYYFSKGELKSVKLFMDEENFVENLYTQGIVTGMNLNMTWHN